jgi:hypothetical protein
VKGLQIAFTHTTLHATGNGIRTDPTRSLPALIRKCLPPSKPPWAVPGAAKIDVMVIFNQAKKRT